MPEELTKEQKLAKIANAERVVSEATKMAKAASDEVAVYRKELGLPAAPENGAGSPPVTTLEAFQKLSPADRTQFYRDNPEQYSKFMEAIRTKSERDLFDKKGAGTL